MNKNPPRWFQHEHHEVKQETQVFSAPRLLVVNGQLVVQAGAKHENA